MGCRKGWDYACKNSIQYWFVDTHASKLNKKNLEVRNFNTSEIEPHQKAKYISNVMVSGGFHQVENWNCMLLKKKTFGSDYYLNIILPIYYTYLLKNQGFSISIHAIFMQDRIRSHIAKQSVKEIKYKFNFILEDWLGNSPDLIYGVFLKINILWFAIGNSS